MSLAADLASNLAARMTRVAEIAVKLADPLTTAINNLDGVLKQLQSSSGLEKLASL